MTSYRINRDGARPLKFTGIILAQSSDRTSRGDNQNRWQEVDIYRTAAGQYVTVVTRRTCWTNEKDSTEALVHAKAQPMVDWFVGRDYGITPAVSSAMEEAGKQDALVAAAWVLNVD